MHRKDYDNITVLCLHFKLQLHLRYLDVSTLINTYSEIRSTSGYRYSPEISHHASSIESAWFYGLFKPGRGQRLRKARVSVLLHPIGLVVTNQLNK